MHGITADPDPIDGFVADVNRLCDRPIQFDRIEMLLIKVQRAGLVDDDDQGFALHAAYLLQRAEGVRSEHTGAQSVEYGNRAAGSDLMQTERAALERAAENSLAQRRASGAILSYELDGWMVQAPDAPPWLTGQCLASPPHWGECRRKTARPASRFPSTRSAIGPPEGICGTRSAQRTSR